MICGRCAQLHHTKDCTSPTAKCANCGDAHSASCRICPVRIQKRNEKANFRFAINPISSNEISQQPTQEESGSIPRRSARSPSPLFVTPQSRHVSPKREADVQVKEEEFSPLDFVATVPSEVPIKKEEDANNPRNVMSPEIKNEETGHDDEQDPGLLHGAFSTLKAELNQLKADLSRITSMYTDLRGIKRSYGHVDAVQASMSDAFMSGALLPLEREPKHTRTNPEPPVASRANREGYRSRLLDSYRPQYAPLTRPYPPPRQIWLGPVGR